MSESIKYLSEEFLIPFKNKRPGEQHIADVARFGTSSLSLEENLLSAKKQDVKYIILGVPEDIGPRANCGNGGAHLGWNNFLSVFLNQQSNHFFDWSQCLVLGEIDTSDLQSQSYDSDGKSVDVEVLRSLCQKLDSRLEHALQALFSHDFEVILIGGGHNNAYPLIKALSTTTSQKVSCSNLDPHADFRPMEGRHSGNPFRYAYEEEALGQYYLIGMHEQKNNQATVDGLKKANFPVTSFQSIFMREEMSFKETLDNAKSYLSQSSTPIGIELDVDAIKNAGASAYSICGFSVEQAISYIHQLSALPNVRYVHLCEGAPIGEGNDTGQLLTQLVYSYVTARNN